MFVPVIVLYAFGVRKRSVLPVLLALMLGIGMAGVYVVPLLAYKHFFDAGAVIRYHDIVALGHHLLFLTSSQVHSYSFAVPGIVTSAFVTLFVAWCVWRGGGGLAARRGLLVILGLGIVLLIPNTGPALITLSRLKVSSFDSFDAYSAKMLFTALFTLGLGLLAYCRVSGKRADPREGVLAVVACDAFALMLPWSAGILKVVPGIEIIQFPWRLCAILNVAAAGLFAAGVNDCLKPGVNGERRPSLPVMITVALTVIAAGNIGWQFYNRIQPLATPGVDASRWIEYPSM